MLTLQTIDAQGHRNVQVGTLFQDPRNVRENAFLNLAIRHHIDRLQLVVPVERANDFRQILARKRLATGQNQNAEIAAQSLGDTLDLLRFHLQLLTRPVVQLVSEEAMRTAHVAD